MFLIFTGFALGFTSLMFRSSFLFPSSPCVEGSKRCYAATHHSSFLYAGPNAFTFLFGI